MKPDVHPGWVGLGWNLTAAGVITRVVNDKPDDTGYSDYSLWLASNSDNFRGFFYNHGALNSADWATSTKIGLFANDWASYPNFNGYKITPGTVKDYAPDEFSFNFLGVSGQFYMSETGQWKVKSDKPLKIEVSSADFLSPRVEDVGSYFHGTSTSTAGFGKIKITDDKGIQYIFGGSAPSIEYTLPLISAQWSPLVPKSWYLTEIISPSGQTIKLTYERGTAIISPCMGYNLTLNGFGYSTFDIVGSVNTTVYLKEIKTPFQSIVFTRSNSIQLGYDPQVFQDQYQFGEDHNNEFGGQDFYYHFLDLPEGEGNWWVDYVASLKYPQLNSIILKNLATSEENEFLFAYTSGATERLKLNSVTEKSASSMLNKVYSFNYHTDIMLPPYLSRKTDSWGFYNGKIQYYGTDRTLFLQSKEPDGSFIKAELLKRIVYPTKGYTDFEFELHDYSKEVDRIRHNPLKIYNNGIAAGGLRIKNISHFESNQEKLGSTEYKYVKNYAPGVNALSSGILGGIDPFVTNSSGVWYIDTTVPMSHNHNGSHIGYGEVTQEFSNGGYIVSELSNFDNGVNDEYMDEPPSFHVSHTNNIDYYKYFTSIVR